MSYTSITCPHCREEKVGARLTSGAQLPDEDGETRYFFVAVCRKCDFPSIILARRTATRLPDGRALIKHVCRTERDPIPNFIDLLGTIPDFGNTPAPDGLPENVASTFAEARDCIQRGAVNLGAMGLHMTLERATRALDADPEKSLGERIQALVAGHVLPPSLGKWASEIALIQSEPAHVIENPSPGALQDARRFTEMFLTCAFTLPTCIDQRRGMGENAGPDEGSTDPAMYASADGAADTATDGNGATLPETRGRPDFRPGRGMAKGIL